MVRIIILGETIKMRMTIPEYAIFQKVHRRTVERWVKEGKLTYELTPSGRKRITGEVKKANG